MTPQSPSPAPTPSPKSQPKVIRRASKVRPVPVREMRVPPALVTQRPFSKKQAEEYAADFDLEKFGIPIVNLRGGVYWILDGQHRIAALKIFFHDADPGAVDCECYEGLDDAEMAEIFLGRDTRSPISPFVKFHIACTAEHNRETDIRRTVEAQGLKISNQNEPKCIRAVSALGAVYDKAGAVVLGQVLRTLRDAYGGDPYAFNTQLMQGLGLIFNRFNGKTQEKELIQRLAQVQHGVRGVLQRAEAQRARTGNQKTHCVAAALVEIYNKGVHPTKRLPSWWKSMGVADE